MKRLFRPTSLIGLAVTFAFAVVVSASGGPPGGGFYSGQTVQNVGSSPATISVTVYNSSGGAVAGTASYPNIQPGASVTFFASDVVPSGSLLGSAIVSSDQPIKAIVNVTNRLGGSQGVAGGTAAAQYGGVDLPATTISFPLAKGGFGPKTTAFYIQNAGSADGTFTASFLMGTGLSDPSPVAYSFTSPTLHPGQMAVIIPADTTSPGPVPSGRIGSLTVTSAQPLAGTVLEYETSTSPALILQGTTGIPTALYDTTILFPAVKKQLGGRSTGLQVQNVSAVTIAVTMTYYGAGGTCPSGSFPEAPRNLAPKQSTTYLDSALLPAGCLASASATTATPSGLLAGVVNEAFIPCNACVQRATTYHAFAALAATHTVLAPVFKQDFGNKRTGLSVQNISGSATTAVVTFKVGASTYTYNGLSIPAGGSALLLNMQDTVTYPNGNWTGGAGGRLPNSSLAAVTVVAGQNIIGVANEAAINGAIQDNINYEAFNQ
jgi:hypothetical protein